MFGLSYLSTQDRWHHRGKSSFLQKAGGRVTSQVRLGGRHSKTYAGRVDTTYRRGILHPSWWDPSCSPDSSFPPASQDSPQPWLLGARGTPHSGTNHGSSHPRQNAALYTSSTSEVALSTQLHRGLFWIHTLVRISLQRRRACWSIPSKLQSRYFPRSIQ